MRIRTFPSFALAVCLLMLAPISAFGQSQTPPDKPQETKPEPKAEAKPTAATLAGNWTVSLESPQGPMEPALVLKADPKDAKKVGGTITSPMGESALEGEVVDGKLTFWITVNGGGGEMSITFVASLQKDGSLAGTIAVNGGEMPWTAVRVKK